MRVGNEINHELDYVVSHKRVKIGVVAFAWSPGGGKQNIGQGVA